MIVGDDFAAGPAYNVSRGLKALVKTDVVSVVYGWDFLKPFTWEVWLVFSVCALVACMSQLLMRRLDALRQKTSPDTILNTEETAKDVTLASFTSLIGASRLFEYYKGPYMRHVSSMIMAIFSVFIMALYSSNLTAFSFPETATTTARSLTDVRDYATHWGFVDVARRVMVSATMNTDSSVRELRGMADSNVTNGIFTPIAPDVWLLPYCTESVRLVDVASFSILYEVIYNVKYNWIADTSRAIAMTLSDVSWSSFSCSPVVPAQRLGLVNVWGVFVIAAVGFLAAISCRVVAAVRTERPLFGNNFRWFDLKTPALGSRPDELDGESSRAACEDIPSVDMFAFRTSVDV